MDCLSSYGLKESYMQKNLVCFTSDDGSVIFGKKSGLDKMIKEK